MAIIKVRENGEWREIDGFVGPPGPEGPMGPPGNDANVTKENITNALGYEPANKEDVNSLFEDLAKQGEAIANQEEALKGKADKEGEYELIETFTVTEDDLQSITRYVRLNAVMVLAEFSKATKTTNAFLAVGFIGGSGGVTGSNFMRADGNSSARFCVGKKNGYWDLSSTGYVRGWGSGQYYGQGNAADVVFVSESPVITSLKLYAVDGAGVIPNGSVIEIWGVRANA